MITQQEQRTGVLVGTDEYNKMRADQESLRRIEADASECTCLRRLIAAREGESRAIEQARLLSAQLTEERARAEGITEEAVLAIHPNQEPSR